MSWGCWQFSSPGGQGWGICWGPAWGQGLVCKGEEKSGELFTALVKQQHGKTEQSKGVPDVRLGFLPQDNYYIWGGTGDLAGGGGWARKEGWNHSLASKFTSGSILQPYPVFGRFWICMTLKLKTSTVRQRWQRHHRISIQSPGGLGPERGRTRNTVKPPSVSHFIDDKAPLEAGDSNRYGPGLTPETFATR